MPWKSIEYKSHKYKKAEVQKEIRRLKTLEKNEKKMRMSTKLHFFLQQQTTLERFLSLFSRSKKGICTLFPPEIFLSRFDLCP